MEVKFAEHINFETGTIIIILHMYFTFVLIQTVDLFWTCYFFIIYIGSVVTHKCCHTRNCYGVVSEQCSPVSVHKKAYL